MAKTTKNRSTSGSPRGKYSEGYYKAVLLLEGCVLEPTMKGHKYNVSHPTVPGVTIAANSWWQIYDAYKYFKVIE